MKLLPVLALIVTLVSPVLAADSAARITPEIRAALDRQKAQLVRWAAEPVLVAAVREQNARGPLPEMTNRLWARMAPDDPIVRSFETNPAGKWLAKTAGASQGMVREIFLNGARGEKVAFYEKPSMYSHAGEEKQTTALSGRVWEGKPEFDKSSYSHVVQVAAPVLDNGRPIGVLVASFSMKSLKGR
jgi:hypothetical protein